MKIIGNAILNSRSINNKEIYYLTIREYNRDGEFEETELYCRLTKKMQELVKSLGNYNDLAIDIKDSFYSVDNYYKGEEKYTKPTLVLSEIEIL